MYLRAKYTKYKMAKTKFSIWRYIICEICKKNGPNRPFLASRVADTIFPPPYRRSPPPTRQSMQKPNEKQQRLSSWAINYEPSDHSQDKKWEGAKVKARQFLSRNTWDKISRTDCTQRKMMAWSSFRLYCKTFSVSLYMFLLHSSFKYKKECSLVFCIWLDESKPEMLNLHFAQC